MKAVATAKSAEQKKKSIKSLIERIPTAKNELFAYPLDWECVDQVCWLIDRGNYYRFTFRFTRLPYVCWPVFPLFYWLNLLLLLLMLLLLSLLLVHDDLVLLLLYCC